MKIIESLRRIKHLTRKIAKNTKRIMDNCSFVDHEGDPRPVYNEDDIRKFHQQIDAWSSEIASLRHRLHKTNVSTSCDFPVLGLSNIDYALCYMNEVIPRKIEALKSMRRKEKPYSDKDGRVVNQFDHTARDKAIDSLDELKQSLADRIDALNISVDILE